MTDPRAILESRIQAFANQENQLKLKSENWAIFRGVIFIFAAAATYFSINYYGNGIAILTFLVGFGGFLYFVNKHLKLKIELKRVRLFIQVNENEINRLSNNFLGLETGLEFAEPNHLYASDLDLFGKHSLFQLLNRAHTFEGMKLLANWMKNPASKSVILERQNAAKELSTEIDFRQNLEVTALMTDNAGESTKILLDWVQSPGNEKINRPILKYGQYLPVLTFAILIGAILGFYTYYFLGLMLLIHGIILKLIDEDIADSLKKTESISDTLVAYANLIQLIAHRALRVNKPFSSEKLLNLSAKIKEAPQSVSQLQKTIHFLSYRSNPVAALGGIILMQDIRNFAKLEKWKTENKDNLEDWLAVVNEFEALNSLGCYQFANPDYTIPIIYDESIQLKTNNLGHPLIATGKRVFNDFETEGVGKTIILTGSNMSGKSTFERTVGINIVLALMGAVVCAKSMECAEMQLFTSMRTQDSLESETSSFYAELKRLELLIQLTNRINQKPIFYLLDEILKGTNSKDRHSGAKALILQLKSKNSLGIISTHDVELGDEFEGENFIKNFSFSSEMIDNELVFDYKLKEGVCHSFNATQLMRRIGIEVAL